ncbi:MAG: Rab family GTPase [Promethearchaeota archaeon]
MDEETRPYYIFKICILGAGGVGKTCLARRLCFNTFDLSTKLTIGIDFYAKDLPIIVCGKESFVRLSIWDFGGQEQFKKLFNYYIGGANGILMVFDLLNLQTLIALEWWYSQIKKNYPIKVPRILIGTKLDLIDEAKNQKGVQDMIIRQYMKSYDESDFIKTSSKDNYNIEHSFKELIIKILNMHHLPYDKLI